MILRLPNSLNVLCIATNNVHKINEIRTIIDSKIKLVSLEEINCPEELPETSDTIEGNSLQKAKYVFDKFKIPCFSDDTGLEVEALEGAPGVYSARYAGEHKSSEDNISLLLKNLESKSNRSARFRTVITLLGIENDAVFFEGIVNGRITQERRGISGFGYDPVFIPDGYQKTYAEMTLQEKSSFSHRAIALKKLEHYLKNVAITR
jgi:XTP/dITP diphosphohydrolase